jgi:hypothetical protein
MKGPQRGKIITPTAHNSSPKEGVWSNPIAREDTLANVRNSENDGSRLSDRFRIHPAGGDKPEVCMPQ